MGPVYVPVLPVRRAAWRAYERLDEEVRTRIAPLWTVVPRTGPERVRGDLPRRDPEAEPAALSRWLPDRLDQFLHALSGSTGWIDATHVERLVDASAVGLWRLATRSRLCLVTGPERDRAFQHYIADLAFLTGRGMGIRILLDTPPAEARAADLLGLVSRAALPPEQLDLVLDLGPVDETTDASKVALAALDLMGGLLPWRTIVLAGGAFPRMSAVPDDGGLLTLPRHDWHIHQLVRAARPGFADTLLYGDYSTEHALSANIPSVPQPGPPWGLMRYTGEDAYLTGRAPTRGPHRADRVRAMARRIVENEAFRPDASDGERWLNACTHGDGGPGSGNAETWIQVGHSQHMSLIVHQLLTNPG